MSKVTKEVKFYEAVIVTAKTDTKHEKTKRVKDDFWSRALTRIDALPTPKDRSARIGQRQCYGVVVRPSSPVIDHLQVGRLRDLSEYIEETDLDSGLVAPLVLSGNRRVSEPTFIVPFLVGGRVAIRSSGR